MKSIFKNKKADMMGLIVGLLMGFMVITMLMSLLPAFVEMIDYGQSSASLNCVGYVDTTASTGGTANNLSYNPTIGTKSSIGCLALKLYIPYLVLGVLVAIVTKMLYDKATGQQQQYYG